VKIADRIYLVGSGAAGLGLTDDYDCHVYLIDGGEECTLIDAGGGRDPDAILAQIEADGIDRRRVRSLLLTHGHADHSAGAAGLRERLGLRVLASPEVARFVREGDERGISLDVARTAGMYPPDFGFPACPVEGELADGATVRIGDLEVQALDTPGHCAGHVAYAIRAGGLVSAFTGDALFCDGKISLQYIWDCSVLDAIRSVERLAELSLDGMYPGHGAFAVRGGRRHAARAMGYITRLVPPPQMG
jgi:glyoxylase-like metal-dependent hydrolase (beta-lactamase superfamily II)